MKHAPSHALSASNGFGIGERPQQACMFLEHGKAAFWEKGRCPACGSRAGELHSTAPGNPRHREQANGPCSLCAAPAIGECEHEGLVIVADDSGAGRPRKGRVA